MNNCAAREFRNRKTIVTLFVANCTITLNALDAFLVKYFGLMTVNEASIMMWQCFVRRIFDAVYIYLTNITQRMALRLIFAAGSLMTVVSVF